MANIFSKNRKSFTLIELLVVLALVAILSVVVVVTLNPAELLRQARDSNRLSDLATINTALNLFSTDVTGGFMGTSTVIYVSIPDTSPTCANLGLPAISTSTYSYSCVTRENLRHTDGSGWIPVNFGRISSNSPISQLPIDPINTTTSFNYYTYVSGGSWKLSAILEAQKNISVANLDGGIAPGAIEIGTDLNLSSGIFPAGWIKVPGDSRFGTSDFWVMKYEAKCSSSSAPGIGLTSPTSTYGPFDGANGACSGANGRMVTSVPSGYPIGRTDPFLAMNYCQTIGAHLMTSNEWQTLSWNLQAVPLNWQGGIVGVNYIYSGHNDQGPYNMLAASENDSDGYFGTNNSSGNQRRTLTLSNGHVVWDAAGNIYEWTNSPILSGDQPYADPVGFAWREFTSITNWGTLSRESLGPLDPTWNSANGVGQIYSSGSSTAFTYYFLRGGAWAYTTTVGISSARAEFVATWNGPYGFRCAR
jgi:prepilin-type N-terminal cleavage/methylation domain-containing protein